MSDKKRKKPKKVRKAKNKEFKTIADIINKSLKRILLGKTKKTYVQEVHFISKTIQGFIETSYIARRHHKKELLEQKFGYINKLMELKQEITESKEFRDGLDRAILELKGADDE